MKLLNLDRLEALGKELKPGSEDEARLARLGKRAELAEVQARLPALEESLGRAAADLAAAEAATALQDARRAQADLAALDHVLVLGDPQRGLVAVAELVDALAIIAIDLLDEAMHRQVSSRARTAFRSSKVSRLSWGCRSR